MSRTACLLVIALAALGLAACALEPPPRTVPAGFAKPRFMLISDEAQGPLLLGGDFGLRSSFDGGRTWQTPAGGDAAVLAGASYADAIVVSHGSTSQSYGYALTGSPSDSVAWPFAAPVTLLAGRARQERVWAITMEGTARLSYSNDGGAYWWPMPAIGLCAHPRMLAVGPGAAAASDRLWVACGWEGLAVSDDLGVHFHQVAGIYRALDVAVTRAKAGLVVVSTPQVAVTKDDGETWTYTSFWAERIAIDPRNADLVFAIGRDSRLHASLDSGLTF